MGDLLLEAREIEFVPCSEIFRDVVATFRGQRDGALSFTDPAIVTIARLRDAGCVASFDRDLVDLEGIQVVPGSAP